MLKPSVVITIITIVGLFAVSLSNANQLEQTVFHLVCTSGDKNSPQGKSSKAFAEDVLQQSNGRIKINVFYQNELGGQNELFDQLLKGNVHFMLEWPLTAYDQRLSLGMVPYLVLGWDDAFKAYSKDGWLNKLMTPIFAENGLKFLGPYPEGFGGVATRGRYATNASDAQGIKVRSQTIFPLPQTVVAMGFEAVPIDWSEVYTSIQTGVVDGDSGNIIYWGYEYFGDVLDYYVHSKQNFASAILTMNLDSWSALSKSDQAIIERATDKMVEKQFKAAISEDEYWIKTAQENGMKYIQPSAEELSAWVKKVREEVWPQVEKAYGSEIMKQIRKNASTPQ